MNPCQFLTSFLLHRRITSHVSIRTHFFHPFPFLKTQAQNSSAFNSFSETFSWTRAGEDITLLLADFFELHVAAAGEKCEAARISLLDDFTQNTIRSILTSFSRQQSSPSKSLLVAIALENYSSAFQHRSNRFQVPVSSRRVESAEIDDL
jgi:hypothetical protein